MPNLDNTIEQTNALLNDNEEEEEEIPTQVPTPTQDFAFPPHLGQSQLTVSSQTQDSLSQKLFARQAQQPKSVVTHLLPDLSQLSQVSGTQWSNPFASIEQMLALQSQAQAMPMPHVQEAKAEQGNELKAKKAPPNKKKNENKRGPNFTTEEWYSLFDLIAEMIPLGTMKWEQLAARHEANGYPSRTADSLKRRWNEKKKEAQAHPTGDPDMPPLLQRVRAVAREVTHKLRAKDLSEEADIVEGFKRGQCHW
jgi:hypothetical protein